MDEDYYKILGLRRDASQSDIQDAYRELARKHHPDVNPNDKSAQEKFQKIQKAFDVLSDQKKREMYDRYGSSFETIGTGGPQGGPGWGGGAEPDFGHFEGGDFDFTQFFDERFGGSPGGGGFADIFKPFRRTATSGTGRPRSTRRRGADIHHELPIPFATSINGGKVQITVRRRSGKTETITVNIPAGIEDGKKIRLRGQGEPAHRSGKPGDILLSIRVLPHDHFQRHGKHLHLKLPVTLAEAALGATVDVPTPKGTVSLHVPPGTSSGTKLRIKGHGVNAKGQTPGDLLAEIQIVLPNKLDAESKQAIEQFAKRTAGDNPRANLRW